MTTWYARSDVTYKGGDRLFTIPFSYIKKEDIRVFVNDYDTNVEFEFLTSNTILINSFLEIEDIVSIRRCTDISKKEVTFTDTSLLDEASQNLAQDQLLFAVQENLDENARFVEISETVTDSLQQIEASVVVCTDKAHEATEVANQIKESADNTLNIIDTKKAEITTTADAKITEINKTAEGYEATIITGRYIGEIIYSLFPIDNPCVRKPDGSIIAQDGIYQKSVAYFKKLVEKYPMFSKTEEEWQAIKEKYGEVPAIVIDDEAGTIRLPLIVNPLKGVTDMSQLAQVVEAGLPNIEGNIGGEVVNSNFYSATGAFKKKYTLSPGGISPDSTRSNILFDASLSNPIYGKSDTVQPQQPTGCYYMVLATGVEEEASITNTFEINNPYALLQPIWSDKKLNNLSWLRSNGQSNSKASYPDAYDYLLEQYNNAPLYESPNVIQIGSPSINDGVISNFSSTQGVICPVDFTPQNNPWEVCIKFTTDSDITSNQNIVSFDSVDYKGFLGYIRGGTLWYYASSNGTKWNVADQQAVITLAANTTYYVKWIFDGSRYVVQISTDGTTFTDNFVLNSTTALSFSGNTNLGLRPAYAAEYFKGTIDLNESYININGERFWEGVLQLKDQTESVADQEITYRRSADGLKVTTDKAAFDLILEAAGTAWYYVIDTANEVFYLPQSNGFMQFGGEGDFVEAGLPNITGTVKSGANGGDYMSGAFYYQNSYTSGVSGRHDGGSDANYSAGTAGFSASRSSAVYGKSDTVQPEAVKGYLYFYVGETIQNANLVNIGRLQEQLIERTTPAQAAHAAMPGGKWVDLTLGASGTKYTAPEDGYFSVHAGATAVWGWVNISDADNNGHGINPTNNNTGAVKGILPVKKGTTVVVSYGSVNNFSFKFIYAQGAQQ